MTTPRPNFPVESKGAGDAARRIAGACVPVLWPSACVAVVRIVAAVVVVTATVVRAQDGREDPIVVSRVFNGYARKTTAAGSFEPETYAFGNGGLLDGQPTAADTLYALRELQLFQILAKSLATQNYVSGTDAGNTKLLITVTWGTTRDTKDKPTAYVLLEDQNARLLGFDREAARARDISFTAFATDVFDELRVSRYFVVLQAFDFQLARREKRLKLLWESRFSIRRQGRDFVAELPSIARFAARSFGRENSGMIRPPLPKGRVDFGPLRVLSDPPDRQPGDGAAAPTTSAK